MTSVDVHVRGAAPSDVDFIVDSIRALADYERLAHECAPDAERLTRHLFGEPCYAEALIAEIAREPVGYALFFPSYSTFLTRPGLFLEDLFVHPDARGRGAGKALLDALVGLARERGYGRVEWSVLDWNEPAIGLYSNGEPRRGQEGTMKATPQSHAQLTSIIDSVVESYSHGRNIDNLESSALPNKRKVIKALIHIKNILYMGYYATRELSTHNLRQHVGAHFHDAFELLVEQISRAVAYGTAPECRKTADAESFSEEVVLEVFSLIPEIREKLALDVEAAYRGDPAARTIEEVIYSYPATEAITVYRIAHEFQQRCVPLIPRIMTEYAHGATGIEIHPGAVIGKRFFIDHGTGVVVGETSVIGDDVKMYQGVTLGALSVPRDHTTLAAPMGKRHPTLEDRVTVYAGATILGGDTVIGHDSVIGSNVWLTKSVAPGTRVTMSMAEGEGENAGRRFQTEEVRARKQSG